MDKIFVCELEDLRKKKFIVKWIEDWNDEIIIFINKKNQIKIKSSICPHFGGEIIFDSKNNELKCLWHNWKFCEDTGKCKSFPIRGKLNPYDFDIEPQSLRSYNSEIIKKNLYAIKK